MEGVATNIKIKSSQLIKVSIGRKNWKVPCCSPVRYKREYTYTNETIINARNADVEYLKILPLFYFQATMMQQVECLLIILNMGKNMQLVDPLPWIENIVF